MEWFQDMAQSGNYIKYTTKVTATDLSLISHKKGKWENDKSFNWWKNTEYYDLFYWYFPLSKQIIELL